MVPRHAGRGGPKRRSAHGAGGARGSMGGAFGKALATECGRAGGARGESWGGGA